MCSICGIIDYEQQKNVSSSITEKMSRTMKKRGPDQSGSYQDSFVSFHHNRLSILDIENGKQPMIFEQSGKTYVIVYNGELYNLPELKKMIQAKGLTLKTHCDTEVVLLMYVLFGKDCTSHLNGIFAFAIYDKANSNVFLARDRFGIKPFYYVINDTSLLFASEIKALLAHPSISPVVDQYGIWQLIFLSPCKLPSYTIFRDIKELEAGCQAIYNQTGLHIEKYWQINAIPLDDSREDAIAKTRDLVTNAIERQLISDVPLCTLLSGGLDSSIVSSVSARNYQQSGKTLSTYSFEYEGNKENFKSSLFQPEGDDKFALSMANYLQTNHTVLQAPTKDVVNSLLDATLARDFPGQSDIDSSLLYYFQRIKQSHTVALSGECADEIFGGYPWFYRKEMLSQEFFPWIHNPFLRADLFSPCFRIKEGYHFLCDAYRKILSDCPLLEDDSESMLQSRKATWLSVNLFMSSLLERKDRMSMAASVEVRVPFADHRILEYVYNIPWEIKFENKTEKALLRNAMKDCLPTEIYQRKKSPYPKTHNPEYERLVLEKLTQLIKNPNSRIGSILDRKKLLQTISQESTTWFGQLMAKPQLYAWLLQLEYWLQEYQVDLQL